VESPGVRHPIADVGQVLKDYHRTAVLDGFYDEFVRHPVKVLVEAARLFVSNRLDVLVGVPRPALLRGFAALDVLLSPVVQLVGRLEHAGRSDSDVLNPEVHAENYSVLCWSGVVHVCLCSHVRVGVSRW
jgi:hypothetical protein